MYCVNLVGLENTVIRDAVTTATYPMSVIKETGPVSADVLMGGRPTGVIKVRQGIIMQVHGYILN